MTWQQIYEDALQASYGGMRFAAYNYYADILAGNAARQILLSAHSGNARRFKPRVGELRVADIFCVVLLDQCFSNFFIPSPPFHSRHVVFAPHPDKANTR